MKVERKLSQVLSEFARTLATDFPIQCILDHLVEQVVHVLPIHAAGVTLIGPVDEPRFIAASDQLALRSEQLRSELDEGLCIAADGVGAVFTFPLRHGDERLGALHLYRRSPGRLSPTSLAAAQTLADVATAYVINSQARTRLRESSERAHHRSLHDPLTGLPNRILLAERLEHAVVRTRRSGTAVAVLIVDLDGFKPINDSYGHHVGDDLLIAVAHRLTRLVRPGDTTARLGGDEFVILCEDLLDPAQAEPLAERIGTAFAGPFRISDAELRVTASIGIAFAGKGDSVTDQVLRDADWAMYQAKRRGGGAAVLDLRDPGIALDRAELDRDLRGALDRGEIRTVYQPIVAAASGEITGAKALLRWDHPTRGTIPPSTVIPLAQRAGLMHELGRWVLERACSDKHTWVSRHGGGRLGVAIGVSAQQLMRAGFSDSVSAVLDATRTDPREITLEITESVFMQELERVRMVLADLKALGITIALDDFGTGYSSLNDLKQLPIDTLKIDRTFVIDLERESSSHHIAKAVVGLAHGMGMTVLAEGIDSQAQYEHLTALGCDFCQGTFFARPLSPDEFGRALRSQHQIERGLLLEG